MSTLLVQFYQTPLCSLAKAACFSRKDFSWFLAPGPLQMQPFCTKESGSTSFCSRIRHHLRFQREHCSMFWFSEFRHVCKEYFGIWRRVLLQNWSDAYLVNFGTMAKAPTGTKLFSVSLDVRTEKTQMFTCKMKTSREMAKTNLRLWHSDFLASPRLHVPRNWALTWCSCAGIKVIKPESTQSVSLQGCGPKNHAARSRFVQNTFSFSWNLSNTKESESIPHHSNIQEPNKVANLWFFAFLAQSPTTKEKREIWPQKPSSSLPLSRHRGQKREKSERACDKSAQGVTFRVEVTSQRGWHPWVGDTSVGRGDNIYTYGGGGVTSRVGWGNLKLLELRAPFQTPPVKVKNWQVHTRLAAVLPAGNKEMEWAVNRFCTRSW